MMDSTEREQIRRRIGEWEIATAVLQQERWARLRAMTDEDCRAAIADLLSLPPSPEQPERGSGLVEQQRLFRLIG